MNQAFVVLKERLVRMVDISEDWFGSGYTIHDDDGNTYHADKDLFGDDYTVQNPDGSTTRITKDLFGDGYTVHDPVGGDSSSSSSSYSSSSSSSYSSSYEYVPLNREDVSELSPSLDSILNIVYKIMRWVFFASLAFLVYKILVFYIYTWDNGTLEVYDLTRDFLFVFAAYYFSYALSSGSRVLYKDSENKFRESYSNRSSDYQIMGYHLIPFTICMLFASNALYFQLMHRPKRYFRSLDFLFVNEKPADFQALNFLLSYLLIFVATMVAAEKIGECVRFVLSGITIKDDVPNKFIMALNCVMSAFICAITSSILCDMIYHRTFWVLSKDKLILFMICAVVWILANSFPYCGDNDPASPIIFFVFVWYIIALFNTGRVHLNPISFANVAPALVPSVIYAVSVFISSRIANKVKGKI